MKLRPAFLVFALALTVVACSKEVPQNIDANTAAKPDNEYYVLDESLSLLKQDFNENKDKVRLLFIVGDTCGICLRGMADLNDAFLASAQADDRLLTMVVHVPTLGAQEKHVPEAMQLLNGPLVIHYWDGSGISGDHLIDTLETGGIYAWDVWLAYGPGSVWSDAAPPPPEFWMHQLGRLDRGLRLDAKRFGEMTIALMQEVEVKDLLEPVANEADLLADGSEISSVAQPSRVAISQHIRGRGGPETLEAVQSIERQGEFSSNAGKTSLSIIEDRDLGLIREYANPAISLPEAVEASQANAWEFNGKLFDWKNKGHQSRMSGMRKIGDLLTWKFFLLQSNGMRWVMFVDSHTGDIVLQERLDDDGNLLYSVKAGDFREINGHRLPNVIEYYGSEGKIIATEEYSDTRISTL